MGYITRKSQNGGQEIVISSWEKGIAPSPYTGINDIRAVNVSDIPGAVFASAKTTNDLLTNGESPGAAYLGLSRTFTVNTSTEEITVSSAVPWGYTVVRFTTSSALPASTPQIAINTDYWLYTVSSTVYKVATSYANLIAGTFVNFTGTGTGTQTVTSTTIGIINATAKDERTGFIYAIDSNNRVWCNSPSSAGGNKWTLIPGNTLTSGAGNGIAVWQNYVFAFRGAKIDVFGPANDWTTAAWTNDWQTMNSPSGYSGLHKTFVASNNTLYWTDFTNNSSAGQNPGYVGSLGLNGGGNFTPNASASVGNYIYNYRALDLPDNEQPVALNELNGYLAIGTNIAGFTVSKLYYWDTVSPSFQNPLIVPEAPIYEIVNANNIIYVFCGWRGRVYKTNLASIAEAFKIPDHLYYPASSVTGYEGLPLFGRTSQYLNTYQYKMTFAPQARVSRKKILFCVNLYGSTALWSYDSITGNLQIDAKPSNGYGSSATDSPQLYGVEILSAQTGTTLLGTEILFFGLYYNTGTTTYTIDQYNPITSSDTANFTTYNGTIITDYINVGSVNNLKTFQQLEYSLDRKMITGSGLKIYYRYSIGDSWTLLSTEDYATYGAINGRVIDFPTVGTEWIQLKVEFNPFTVLRDIILR